MTDFLRLLEQVRATQEDRQEAYGDIDISGRDTGLIWTAILQTHYGITLPHPIPTHVVQLMMAGLKVVRCALPNTVEDSWLDLVTYGLLGWQTDPKQGVSNEDKRDLDRWTTQSSQGDLPDVVGSEDEQTAAGTGPRVLSEEGGG
jgi:hypothetical protein